jgi:polar amino acid transport system permease protein
MVIGRLIWRGAAAMEYNWQWYRVQPFFYRIVDGEFIWGPLYWGLLETLKLAIVAACASLALPREKACPGGGMCWIDRLQVIT